MLFIGAKLLCEDAKMLWITFLIPLTVAYSAQCPTVQDPCYRYNGQLEIPDMHTRHPSIKIGQGAYSHDVYKLGFGLWYISDFPLTSTVVENGDCGSKFPIWINGSTPTPSEGYINLTACVKDYNDACADTYNVLAKNCGYYYVYCFWDLPYADQRFCFDVDLSKVTTTIMTTKPTTTTEKKRDPHSEPSPKHIAFTDTHCDCPFTQCFTIALAVVLPGLALFLTGFLIFYFCRRTQKTVGKISFKVTLITTHRETYIDNKTRQLSQTYMRFFLLNPMPY